MFDGLNWATRAELARMEGDDEAAGHASDQAQTYVNVAAGTYTALQERVGTKAEEPHVAFDAVLAGAYARGLADAAASRKW